MATKPKAKSKAKGKTVTIRMRSSICGPTLVARPHEVVEIDESSAEGLVSRGLAEYLAIQDIDLVDALASHPEDEIDAIAAQAKKQDASRKPASNKTASTSTATAPADDTAPATAAEDVVI